jgi:hypothetical protein
VYTGLPRARLRQVTVLFHLCDFHFHCSSLQVSQSECNVQVHLHCDNCMKASTNYDTLIKPLSEKGLSPVVEHILPATSYDDSLTNR